MIAEVYRSHLQIKHHCCKCGVLLAPNTSAISAVVPIQVGTLGTVESIVWCDPCWKDKVPWSQL